VPSALFVCYGGGHAKMIIPVLHELSQHDGWKADVLALTLAGPQMRAAGIRAHGYRDLISPNDGSAIEHGERLLADSHDPRSGIAVEESIAYLGLSYQDLVDRLGPEAAAHRYAAYGRHAFEQFGPLGRAIDRFRPDVVVTTNSPKSERAALVVAAERGIATIGIEDTMGLRQKIFPEFVRPFLADRVCAPSTISADNLVSSWGVPRERIRLTGNPSFDRLGDAAARKRARSRAESTRTVVFFTQAYTRAASLGEVVREALRDERIRFVIRRHPNYRGGDADAVLGMLGPRVILGDDLDLDALLVDADCVVAVSSTSVLESILVGTPVVQLGPGTGITDETLEHVDDLPLYRHGATILARDIADVHAAIARATDPAGSREVTRRAAELFVPPGGAARAVVEQMRELAGHERIS
jgi:hypothetical protein